MQLQMWHKIRYVRKTIIRLNSGGILKILQISSLAIGSIALSLLPVSASANSISGNFNGINWTAQSTLTGVTSTGNTGNPAGDSIYHPAFPEYSGAVHLLMDYGQQGSFICSGTLLNDRRSILTAAHCVSDGAGSANPLTTMVFFQPDGGLPAGTRIRDFPAIPGPNVTAVGVSQYFVHGAYTGDVIDQNDIAVLRLSDLAPAWTRSYGLYTGSDLKGKDFTATGYGRLGDGATGANSFTSRLRTGDNTYDFRLGDSLFGNRWTSVLGEPFAQIEHSWLSDFDNGTSNNDTACRVARASNLAGAAGAAFCDVGLGSREVGVAGGDSGGGDFIGDLIASVNSYGLSFGTPWGDVDNILNSSFGEFSGYVPVYLHSDWINSVMANNVPEPGSGALVLLGLVSLGVSLRRTKSHQE